MQNSQALPIIRALANGLDPLTRRELPPGSPFEQPAVIRALFAAARALEAAAAGEAATEIASAATPQGHDPLATPARADLSEPIAPAFAPSQASAPSVRVADASAEAPAQATPIAAPVGWQSRPANAGKPWSRDEDSRLCQGFDRGVSLQVLAQIHARTQASIESRLARLGKIELPQAPAST